MQRIDPTDIAGINELARQWAGGQEQVWPIGLDRVLVGEDALDGLAELVARYAGGGSVLLVMDHTPMRRGGRELKCGVVEQLGRLGRLTTLILPEEPHLSHAELHADLPGAERLSGPAGAHDVVVALGSGTITDLAKYACTLAEQRGGRRPRLIFVPTAASVTAFTSVLAILLADGAKRSFTARLPDAVVCDLQVLADAPLSMTQAGFGDVLARSVAYGDWYLAHAMGMDAQFSRVAGRLLEPAERAMIEQADAVAAGRPEGVRAVVEALLLAGMAMSLVNQTAPISGWEHVISHYLDMTAAGDGRRMAWHGAQVGVGTLIAARAYERAWGVLDLDRLAAPLPDEALPREHRQLDAIFAPHDPTGRMRAELWRDYEAKLRQWQKVHEQRQRFVERYRTGELAGFLAQVVRPSAPVADALRRAGAPRRFADLNEPVTSAQGAAAVRYAHYVRKRFTLGDLLEQARWLNEPRARQLLDETAAMSLAP